jgi:hypothetical protein
VGPKLAAEAPRQLVPSWAGIRRPVTAGKAEAVGCRRATACAGSAKEQRDIPG